MRNALAHVPKGQHTMVAAAIRQAFLQPDADAAHQIWRHVADQLRQKWPKLAALMDDSERLDRSLALDRNSVHDPALALVVVYGVVLDTAVVPERDRIRPPSEATGEFWPYRVLIEPAQQRLALLLGHVLEADREVAVDIEALASGLDMRAHDRVLDFALRLFGISDRHRRGQPDEGPGGVDAIDAAGAVNRGQPAEHRLHAVG